MGRQGAKTCPVNRGSGLLSQARLGWRHGVSEAPEAPEAESRAREAVITVLRAAID